MNQTQRLYYSSPGIMEMDATVLDAFNQEGKTVVLLDSTPFFPEGGGQPSDLGLLDGSSLELVTEKDGKVLHRLAEIRTFKPGEVVHCSVSTARRRYHTQQHSGQHLLSAVLEKEYATHTVGFHLGAEYCTIDITAVEFNDETSRRVEDLMEDMIIRSLPVRVHVCPPEDPSRFPLRKKLPEGEDSLRIIEIDGYDWVPCCGTHVSSLADLRTVKILSAEKYKGATRLYFVSGDHALSVLSHRFSLLTSCAALAGCSPEEVPARLAQQKARLDILDAERIDLVADRARLEIAGIANGKNVLALVFGSRKADVVQESVRAATVRGFTVIALSRPDRTVMAAYPTSSGNVSAPNLSLVLKPLLAQYGGRGGGGPGNFRAAFQDEGACSSFFDAAISAISVSSENIGRLEL